jgi:hypothetical protein
MQKPPLLTSAPVKQSYREADKAAMLNDTEQPEYDDDHHDASNRNGKVHTDLIRPCFVAI